MGNLKKFIITASLLSGAILLTGCGSDSNTPSGGSLTHQDSSISVSAPLFFDHSPTAPAVRPVLAGSSTRATNFEVKDSNGQLTNYTGNLQLTLTRDGSIIEQQSQAVSNGVASNISYQLPDETPNGTYSLTGQLIDENNNVTSNSFTVGEFYIVQEEDLTFELTENFLIEEESTSPLINLATEPVDPPIAHFKVKGFVGAHMLGLPPQPVFFNVPRTFQVVKLTGPGTMPGDNARVINSVDISSNQHNMAWTGLTVSDNGTYTFRVIEVPESFSGRPPVQSSISSPINL